MDALVPSNTLEDEPKVEDRKDQVRRNTRHTSEGGCERTVEGNKRDGSEAWRGHKGENKRNTNVMPPGRRKDETGAKRMVPRLTVVGMLHPQLPS